jgi:hypothetical protein
MANGQTEKGGFKNKEKASVICGILSAICSTMDALLSHLIALAVIQTIARLNF